MMVLYINSQIFSLPFSFSKTLFFPLFVMLGYNLSLLTYCKLSLYFHPTNTFYEKKKILKYRKSILQISPFFLIITLIIAFYSYPISFKQLACIPDINKALKVSTYEGPSGSSLPDNIYLEQKKASALLHTLNQYQYRRVFFDFPSRQYGGQRIEIHSVTDNLNFEPLLLVWRQGYIQIPGKITYKAISRDHRNVFDDILDYTKKR